MQGCRLTMIVLAGCAMMAWMAQANTYDDVYIPTEKYGTYNELPPEGAVLTLDLKPANGVTILTSSIHCQDVDDLVQWHRVDSPADGVHRYNIDTVLSSREYLHLTGTWTRASTGGSGPADVPSFVVDVPGVDIDIDGIAEEDEENIGAFVGVSNELCKITLRRIQPEHEFPGVKNVVLTKNSNAVRIWTSEAKTAEVCTNGTYTNTVALPRDLYVEGAHASSALRDVKLTLSYTVKEPNTGELKKTEDYVKFTVLKVDLDIDVDDDGNVNDTDEQKEESPGVIVFENWDNDDGDAAHTPDKDETSVTGENDLVPIYPKLEPTLTTGMLKLEATAGGSRVKVWTAATKGTEITLPKTWDLATETVPATLYLEGYDESASANDVELKLSYANGGSPICDDKLNITVVRQNLGVAIYRALDSAIIIWLGGDFNHAGLITGYTGKRTKAALTNDANWGVIEMPGQFSGVAQNTLQGYKAAASPFNGFYSVNSLSDSQRNYVVSNAFLCLADGTIGYTWSDAIDGDGLGLNWDGTIGDIDQLRCDGLVEVCYELANVEVWGRNGTHYLIQNFAEEHNDFGMDEPQTELCPIVQRGGVTNSPTHFISTVLFQPQTLP